MNNFNFFIKKKKELHLTTTKKIKIIEVARIIKKLLIKRNIKITISPSKKKDVVQNNVNNLSNNFFIKYWKPEIKIEEGIEKIINYYKTNKI